MSQDTRIRLSDLIDNLRKELIVAQWKGEGESIKFLVEEVELEVEVTAAKKTGGEVGLEFWVVNTKAEGEVSKETVQKLKLKLKPTIHTQSSNPSSPSQLEINQMDNRPTD